MGLLKDLFMPQQVMTAPAMPTVSTVMSSSKIADIRSGYFAEIPVRRLILKNGEKCFFCDYAVQIKEKLCTVGRFGNGGGISIRICKGVTWHTGTHVTHKIRDKVQDYTNGKLYITNERIVFSADTNAFQKSVKALVSYRTEGNELILQFANSSYRVFLPVVDCAEKTLEYLL